MQSYPHFIWVHRHYELLNFFNQGGDFLYLL